MKAAAYMVVAKKLDEIKAILQAAVGTSGREAPVRSIQPSVSADIPAIQHPCSECGREGSYPIRPNRWNRKGMWLCPIHEPLKYRYGVKVTDERVRNADGNVQGDVPILAPEKKDTGGDTTADSVMAALGVN